MKSVDWKQLALDRYLWWVPVSRLIRIPMPQNKRTFLIC